MSYLALYRKYRPTRFADLVGQEHVVRTLLHALEKNKVSHAYLFSGVRGTGKTSSAKILAKAVNCLNPQQGEPCNACDNCRKINEGTFMDIIEIDAASNRGIDEIRDLREKIKFLPVEGRLKVYIIDEVHMLTAEAFNALLKTLEEPPGHILFILATTEPHKIPMTILSRCQKFDFHRIPSHLLTAQLRKIALENEGKITDEALALITKLAGGGLRDGISLLDQCLTSYEEEITAEAVSGIAGIVEDETILSFFRHIAQGDVDGVMNLYEELKDIGKSVGQLHQDLNEGFKNILVIKTVKNPSAHIIASSETIRSLEKIAQSYTKEQALDWLYRLGEVEANMKRSSHPDIVLETQLIRGMLDAKSPLAPPVNPTARITEEKPKVAEKDLKKEPRPAPAPTPPAPSTSPLNEDQLWSLLLEALGKRNKMAQAYYKEAHETHLDGSALVIRYQEKFRFHKERAENQDNLKLAEELLKTIAGRKIRIAIEFDDAGNTQEKSAEDKLRDVFGDNVTFTGGKGE